MDFINYIIQHIHEDIIFKISNDKIITIDQNTFIERYLRLLYYKKINKNFRFIEIKDNFEYYKNTSRLCDDYYNDLTVNNKLISKIHFIISKTIH